VENSLQIVEADKAILICVKHLESLANLGLLDKSSSICTNSNEVLEINLSITIDITFIDDQVPIDCIFGSVFLAKFCLTDVAYIILGEHTIVLGIQTNEFFL
jgi:hypothetical protein